MDAYLGYLNSLINRNKQEFSQYSGINWINTYSAIEAQEKRDSLLKSLEDRLLFKATKPFYNHISKGCQLCGQGLWSCLFITGKCNANCFYCPAKQDRDEIPESQGLLFPTPESYAAYVNRFGFKGVSFSGGEPLLFPNRVLAYLKEIRKNSDPEIYTWMYTNGLAANKTVFRKLADAGLNEVRFDIGACAYSLDKVWLAKESVPVISIEIPAVPEEKERIKSLLPQMVKAGVKNLNLHQLRLTHYNAPRLLKHHYTYLPAEKPIVLESELAALEIIQHAQQLDLPLGINYCSFFFKHRFQKAGFRRRIAGELMADGDFLTERGFIRRSDPNHTSYDAPMIRQCAGSLGSCNAMPYQISREPALKISWKELQTRSMYEEIIRKEPLEIPDVPDLFKAWQMEYIEQGLRNY